MRYTIFWLSFGLSLLLLSSCSLWQSPPGEALPLQRQLQQHWPDLSEMQAEYWPADAPARYHNQLLRLRLQLPASSSLSDAEIRRVMEPWLLEQQHPEALCLSIERHAEKGQQEILLTIVCRL